MYEPIIRDLMKSDLFAMMLCALLFLAIPISIYVYVLIKDKKKKKKKSAKKKKWNSFVETAEDKALAVVIVGVIFFCITFGMALYDYLSLREDMLTENYVTHTGEFECYSVRSSRSSTRTYYVQWTNENGEVESIKYNSRIDEFQEHDKTLKKGYYQGTIVYSPRGDVLLWWDAEPIGE